MDNVNSWKNKEVFDKQLDLNIKELDGKYPRHWVNNIELLSMFKPTSILDIGCGCGAFYKVCKEELPAIKYFGTDYSREAIDLATETWGEHFEVLNYKDLTKEYVSKYDVLYLSALLDILHDGDQALEFILSLEAKQLLISRVKLTNKDSNYKEYIAYNSITTYAYYHNIDKFFTTIKDYGYEIAGKEDNFYLSKKEIV
jgi:2-polyprenyl-3-methyl-5-hydroxy-6-metoxy-1,4-benzoquinol methylase